MPHRRSTPPRSRPVLLGVVAMGLLAVLLVGLMAWQGWTVYRASQQADQQLAAVRERLLDRDVDGAELALANAQRETAAARGAIDGPLWGLASRLPGIGDDVEAVQRLTLAVDDVTQGALPAAITALSYVDPRQLGFRDGGVRLEPLREGSTQLSRAAELLAQADQDAAAIETEGLVTPVASRVDEAQQELASTSRLASNAAVAGELLPTMLGGDGRRDYLLLAQNTAEQRSLGGIVGAMAVLRAEDGKVTLLRQAVAADIGSFETSPVQLTDAERALYGTVLGQFPQNVTDTPDFPRAAELIKAMWEERISGQISGVVSIDPWALQLLLDAVGPVETPAGRLTGENAAERLLVDVYAEVSDPEQQNEVFADSARLVFDKVREFAGDPRELTAALADGVDQRRIMVWSAREAEQEVLATTPLGGALKDPTPETPRVGVYLHDRTASKMSTYQRVDVRVRPESCETAETAQVRVNIASVAPEDRDLPLWVTGDGSRATRGDMRTQVIVYAPPGWSFTRIESSDDRTELVTYRHDGLWAATRDFLLPPGAERTLTLTMTGNAVTSPWDVRYTPGTRPDNVRTDVSDCS